MRTATRVTLALLAIAIATAIGFVAYQAGIDAGAASSDGTEVVRVVGDGWRGGPGFFPGFLFFPLFIIGFILLLKFVFRPWGWGWHGPPGGHGWEDRAADWHRRQHDQARRGRERATGDDGHDWPEPGT